MDRIDDQRVIFYLKHRRDIDAWAALRKEASQVLDDFLKESAEEIGQLALQLGDEVISRFSLSSQTRAVRLLRKDWRVGKQTRAAIQLAWPGTQVLWGSAPAVRGEPPYVSVWVNRHAGKGVAIAKALRASLAPRAKKLDLSTGASTSSNPVWKYQVPKEEKYWEDLGIFRQHLISQVEWFWTEFSADIDSAL